VSHSRPRRGDDVQAQAVASMPASLTYDHHSNYK